jgi:hypothetical protein
MLENLNKAHRLFVEAYDGDVIYACRIAGIGGASASDAYLKKKGEELLKQPLILDAIKDRSKYILSTQHAIATREERQALWTAIMKNEDPHRKEEVDSNGVPIPEGNIPLPIRLKASELLGKSEADFVDRIDMSVQHSLSDLIQQSYQDDTPIEAIEAEYRRIKNKENQNQNIPTIEVAEHELPHSLEELL